MCGCYYCTFQLRNRVIKKKPKKKSRWRWRRKDKRELKPTCVGKQNKQNIPSDKRYILLASPFRKQESFCCTPSMIPCFRKVLSNLVCIISNLLWCKAWILLHLVYNHNSRTWGSLRAKKYPKLSTGSVQRCVCHSRHILLPLVRDHMAVVSCTSGASQRQTFAVELLSIP